MNTYHYISHSRLANILGESPSMVTLDEADH